MAEKNLARCGDFVTFRLLPTDRQLLQDLGRGCEGVPDRYHALSSLAPIVRELEIPVVEAETRKPLRVKIPRELDAAIREAAERTGQTYVNILLQAAREYRRRHPCRTDTGD